MTAQAIAAQGIAAEAIAADAIAVEAIAAEAITFLQQELQRIDGPLPPAMVQTHISLILLGATRAWKVKKAVQLPYLDFRAVDRRLALSERELALNRRTAPSVYKAVRRLVRTSDGTLKLDGEGALIEAVLEMNRFDEDRVLDAMARRHALTPQIVTRLAQVIADFHEAAEPATGLARTGSQRIGDILQLNARALDAACGQFGDGQAGALVRATLQSWQRLGPLLDERQRAGQVRLCHGDLHLRNIVCIEDVPTLFDCLEFDEDMATVDVLYDLAFVLMDLWHRDLQDLANLLLNRYLDQCDDTAGLPLLGLFMSVRAAVRAHVLAAQAREMPSSDSGRAAVTGEARAYLDLAAGLLQPRPARLVAIGGLSGTGKSTAAAAVAATIGAAPGARILSSDRVRKAMLGVALQTRLGPQAYRSEVSSRVYAALRARAAATLATGHSVVVDAVFNRPMERERIEAVAAAATVRFQGVWLEAPAAVLLDRVAQRRGDPSDADASVVRRQLARPVGRLQWPRMQAGDDQAWTLLRGLLDNRSGADPGAPPLRGTFPMSTNQPVDPTDMNPAEIEVSGSPADGVDVCPECEGHGVLKDNTECTNCGGTGRIAQAVGGA